LGQETFLSPQKYYGYSAATAFYRQALNIKDMDPVTANYSDMLPAG